MMRDLFLGFIRLHIFYHTAEAPIFGLDMIRELARHGYELSPGTRYPILHKLHRAGYLEQEIQVVGGKQRKYYRTTPAARRWPRPWRRCASWWTKSVSDIFKEAMAWSTL